jgi:Family of unknown function (DUF6516)
MLPKELHEEALLGFDGTVYRFDGGYEISLEIRRVDPSEDIPHGFRYSFVLRGPGADGQPSARIFGYDNAHAPTDTKRPHDHLHKTKRGPGGHPVGVENGTAFRVASIDELIGSFLDRCFHQLSALGVDVRSLAETASPAKKAARPKVRRK